MYMYERYDAKNWSFWRCLPGALTLLVPRFLMMFFSTILLGLTVNILMIGTTANDKPLSSVRRGCIQFWVKFTDHLHAIFGWWVYCTYEYIKCDYEEYLGK